MLHLFFVIFIFFELISRLMRLKNIGGNCYEAESKVRLQNYKSLLHEMVTVLGHFNHKIIKLNSSTFAPYAERKIVSVNLFF